MTGRLLALPSAVPPPCPEADAIDAQADAHEAIARALRAQAAARRARDGAPVAHAAPEPLVGRHEIARLLDVSVATVDRLDREGQPHVRVGDTKKYDRGEVLAWHRARPAEEKPATAPAELPPAATSGVRRVSVGGRRGGGR
jgi:hypothetical protein